MKKNYNPSEFCLVSSMIYKYGNKIGFMYREHPDEFSENDSGWRFLAGTETQDFVDNDSNSKIFELESIISMDAAIVSYLNLPYNTELERVNGKDIFKIIE